MSGWDNLDNLDLPFFDVSDQQEIGSTERRVLSENPSTTTDGPGETSSHPTPQSSGMIENSQKVLNFRVRLDVRQFRPNEVMIEHNGVLVSVHGKHVERSDEHGFISREFTRKYEIPADVDPKKMTCFWHPNNVLIIKAPRDSRQRSLEEESFQTEPLLSSADINQHLEI